VTYGIVQPGAEDPAGVPIVRVNNFNSGSIVLHDLLKVSKEVESKYGRTRLRGGEVLLTLVGSVGQVAIAPASLKGCNVARAVGMMRPKAEVGSRWLSLCLRSPESQRILGLAANTTVQTTINLKDVRALPIPLPPTQERLSIEETICAFDDKIALLRETNATLESVAQALFKSWFVDFDPVRAKAEGRDPEGVPPEVADLLPSEFEGSELGSIPKGWKIRTMEELATRIGMGPFGSNIKVSTFVEEGIPVISGQHLRGTLLEDSSFNFVTSEHAQQLSGSIVGEGDVVFTHAGNIGQVALIPKGSRYSRYLLSQRQFYLRSNSNEILPTWITYFFKSSEGQHVLLANASQVGVPSIARPVSYLKSIKVVAPPVELAKVFDTIVNTLISRIVCSRNEIKSLVDLRDTLLPRLMSGKLRISVCAGGVGAML
jgi:type I restriction enzyme S subunit